MGNRNLNLKLRKVLNFKNRVVKTKLITAFCIVFFSTSHAFAISQLDSNIINSANTTIQENGSEIVQQVDNTGEISGEQATSSEKTIIDEKTTSTETQLSAEAIKQAAAEVLKAAEVENYQRIIKKNPLLILVNSSHFVPFGWKVDLVKLKNGQAIDKKAYPELQKMLNDARKKGLKVVICSSYRTNEKQTSLYFNKVAQYKKQGKSEEAARKLAGEWVAIPGSSEHELGLAVDLVSESNRRLDQSQEKTAVQKWLMKNCWRYGFILRYPSNKKAITGINYEPWHYRYVGLEAAKTIMEKGICLEEYYNIVKQ